MNLPTAPTRRGVAGIALVLALVIIQLVIVSAVLAGPGDQELTIQRLNTARSFYAAEAGANMAIRELMNNADEDGDGGVGSISDDGNAANDPALGIARFCVTLSVSGPNTTATSRGRSGAARRQIQMVTQ